MTQPTMPEGHFTITKSVEDTDCDHGPCTGIFIEELKVWIWRYTNDPTRISIDTEDEG